MKRNYYQETDALDTDDVIGQLRKRRKELGISQDKLAALIGIDNTTIQKWEYKRNGPTYFLLVAWCQALNMELTLVEKLPETTELEDDHDY